MNPISLPFEIRPIGVIHSPFKTRFGTPRQPHLAPSAHAVLELFPNGDLNGCLDGLKDFSHVWVLFLFHENTNSRVRGKVHPPRLEGQSIGLFASRSPHRPNPIGLSAVKVESVSDWSITVSGCDFIDGTPIIDIKPYIVESDCYPQAQSGWTQDIDRKTLSVIFSEMAELQLNDLVADKELAQMRDLIVETLQQDPRPVVYKHDKEQRYRSRHAVYLKHLDIHFEYSTDAIHVLEIKHAQK